MLPAHDLKMEARKFGETVSIRGISRVLKSPTKFVSTFWFFAVLASSCILVWQLWTIISSYVSYPITTKYTEGTDLVTFPDITLCNIYPLIDNTASSNLSWNKYMDYINKQKQIFTLEKVRRLDSDINITADIYNYLWASLQMLTSYMLNFPATSGNEKDSFKDLVIDHYYNSWNLNYMDLDYTVNTTWNGDYYRCHTFRLSWNKNQMVAGLTAVLFIGNFPKILTNNFCPDMKRSRAEGVRLVVHNPGTKPYIKNGVSVGPGTETTISIIPTIRSRLKSPYNRASCTSATQLPDSSDIMYSYEACYDVCVQDLVLDRCGCLNGNLQFTPDQLSRANFTVYGNQSFTGNDDNLTDPTGIKDILCTLHVISDDDYYTCDGKCLLPCVETTYTNLVNSAPWPYVSQQLAFYNTSIAGNSKLYGDNFAPYAAISNFSKYHTDEETIQQLLKVDLIKENFLQINFVMGTYYPFLLMDSPSLTSEIMLSSIGGALSLWLGITVMTLVEVAEFVYQLIVICNGKQKSTPESNRNNTC